MLILTRFSLWLQHQTQQLFERHCEPVKLRRPQMWLPLLVLGAGSAAGVLGAKLAAISRRLKQTQARPQSSKASSIALSTLIGEQRKLSAVHSAQHAP